MASVKNAKPSSENGIPMIAPACSMNPGQSKPSSNESTVPETAPTANKMAVPFAHRLQRSRYTACFVRRYVPSAMAMSSGMPMPSAAKTMWKASDIAICERAKRKSPIPFQRDRFQVLINPKDDHVPNPMNPTLIVLLLSQTGVLRPLHGPEYLFSVAAGVPPAVEPSILPGGLSCGLRRHFRDESCHS